MQYISTHQDSWLVSSILVTQGLVCACVLQLVCACVLQLVGLVSCQNHDQQHASGFALSGSLPCLVAGAGWSAVDKQQRGFAFCRVTIVCWHTSCFWVKTTLHICCFGECPPQYSGCVCGGDSLWVCGKVRPARDSLSGPRWLFAQLV